MFNLNFTEEQLKACQYALNNHMDIVMSVPHLLRQDLQYSLLEYLKENKDICNEDDLKRKANDFLNNVKQTYIAHTNRLMKFCFNNKVENADSFLKELAYAKTNPKVVNLVRNHILVEQVEENFEDLPQFVDTIMFLIKRNQTQINEKTLRRELAEFIHVRQNTNE